jgi:hypothetical protein
MKREKKRVQMWVHPNFHKEAKIQCAELGKNIEKITEEFAQTLKEKRKKNRNNGFF